MNNPTRKKQDLLLGTRYVPRRKLARLICPHSKPGLWNYNDTTQLMDSAFASKSQYNPEIRPELLETGRLLWRRQYSTSQSRARVQK